MELEKTTWMNMLYDFYSSLLTDKQKEYLELYYADDLSLGEIAQEFSVSRQAVYDNIKRTSKLLEQYESQLQLVADYQRRKAQLEALKEYVAQHYATDERLNTLMKQMEKED